LSLLSEQETDEDGLLGGEFDGIQSRREQPHQRFEHAIESSILIDLIFRETPEEEYDCKKHPQTSKKKSSSTNAFQNSNQHNTFINFNINFDLEFSKNKDRTDIQNSKNPFIKILVQKPMKETASNSNVENTYA
jgi:hypothetical protein